MIGDWVKFPIGNEKVCDLPYVGGKGLCASFSASATLFPVEVDKLEPIPLTPEILEKSGWVKFRVWYRLRIDDSQYMEYYPHKGRLERIYDNKGGWHEVVFTIDGLNYVHQIQHALRLLGLQKDIEL